MEGKVLGFLGLWSFCVHQWRCRIQGKILMPKNQAKASCSVKRNFTALRIKSRAFIVAKMMWFGQNLTLMTSSLFIPVSFPHSAATIDFFLHSSKTPGSLHWQPCSFYCVCPDLSPHLPMAELFIHLWPNISSGRPPQSNFGSPLSLHILNTQDVISHLVGAQ